ncbi:MAG: cobalt transporter CbiM [Cyanobacteria bacterium J06648_16]
MHVPDGFLPAPVCIAGYGLTGLVTWYSIKRINRTGDPTSEIPKASLLAAAFFVASSIHIPVPPLSVHLVLNGLLGAVLGFYAFPAILVGLFFQAMFIGHGGLTTLGVNACIMGLPALVAYGLFRLRRRVPGPQQDAIASFLAGSVGVGLAALLFIGLIVLNVPPEMDAAAERTALLGLGLAHVPLVLAEGAFTALLVAFLQRVKPELVSPAAQRVTVPIAGPTVPIAGPVVTPPDRRPSL